MGEHNKTQTEVKTHRSTFWGLICLLVLTCILYPFIIRWAYSLCSSARHLEQCGLIGDSFGALNAFISGCAFIAVVISLKQQTEQIKLQREDLKNQRDDLALQREEMKKSREEAARQTQQFKLNRAVDDIYNRFAFIRQLESSVEIKLYNKSGKPTLKGEAALFEVCHIIQQLFQALFPDNENDEKPLNLNYIQYDCISVAVTFEYIDSWLKSYRTLIEDVCEALKNDKVEEVKYLRMLLSGTNGTKLSIIYVFHDTFTKYRNFDSLFSDGVLSYDELLSCTWEKKKRELFSALLLRLLDAFYEKNGFVETTEVIWEIANEWRRYKGWQTLLPRIVYKTNASDASRYGCTLDVGDLVADKQFMDALKQQKQSIPYETICSANSSILSKY